MDVGPSKEATTTVSNLEKGSDLVAGLWKLWPNYAKTRTPAFCTGFFFAPVLRSSWQWWQSWINDVLVHQMQHYKNKEEYLKKNKQTKTAPTTNTQNKTNTKQVAPPKSETVKLALRNVNPALSTSLLASSSAVLLDDFAFTPSTARTICLWKWVIFPSSFCSPTFFERVVFFGFLVCDGHRNFISTDNLQKKDVSH